MKSVKQNVEEFKLERKGMVNSSNLVPLSKGSASMNVKVT